VRDKYFLLEILVITSGSQVGHKCDCQRLRAPYNQSYIFNARV